MTNKTITITMSDRSPIKIDIPPTTVSAIGIRRCDGGYLVEVPPCPTEPAGARRWFAALGSAQEYADSTTDRSAARALLDDAARALAEADIELGDPGCDVPLVERRLLDGLSLVLHALAALRAGRELA